MFGDRHPPSGFVAVALAVLVVAGVSVAAAGTAAAPTLSASSATADVDAETTVEVTLSEVPDGLSGFNVTLRVADPAVGTVVDVSINDDLGLKETTVVADGAGVRLKGVDIDDVVQSGDGPVTLATVTLHGDAEGASALTVDVDQVDDDDGNRIDPALGDGSFTVESGTDDPSTTTTESTTSEPRTTEPTTSESTTSEATTSESTTSEPTTTESTTSEPTTTESTTSEPTTESTTSAPTTTDSNTTAPTSTATTQTTSGTTTDDGPTPGFGIVILALALLATAAIAIRRQ